MNDITTYIDQFVGSYNDKSKYYEYEDIKVPRVTQIISRCIHDDSFLFWANSLGFKHLSYNKTINFAAEIGTHCHSNIDSFIEDNEHIVEVNIPVESKLAYSSFLKWWNDIHSNAKVDVLMHEKTLVCKYFGGTLDGFYKINGKKYLVDYKTSNHVSFRYVLQLAAYRYMLRTELGLDMDGAIILQLSKNEIAYNEYVINFDQPSHLEYMDLCEQCFLSMVYTYYNLFAVEQKYKYLGW